MSILLTGSSGFIGSHLRPFLESKGYQVVCWNKDTSHPQSLENFYAIIHLAGAGISQKRWTKRRKQILLSSRINTTSFFKDSILKLKSPPKVFLSASAIGFYGDRKDEILKEDSPQGVGFLASLCEKWESSAKEIASSKTRLVYLRFGIVLGDGGGMLKKLKPLFYLGLGGIFGDGNQYMSSISLEDALKGILFCLENPSLEGAVNFVSPHPKTQKEWARSFATKLTRPLLFRYPAYLLRLFAGEMADELILTSQRVIPQKLLEARFPFSQDN